MIRTDIDIKDFVYGLLKGSYLAEELSGGIYKDKRPINSQKEDMVIGVLARDAGAQIQTATVNVNIYIANIKRGQETVEDSVRLRQVSRMAMNQLAYGKADDVWYEVTEQQIYEVNQSNCCVINNRLRLKYNNE